MTSHAEIARSLLHLSSSVTSPAVSSDGRVAFVVATIDLDDNITRTRVWLDGAPISSGPHDRSPAWAPDGRHLAFASRRGEKTGSATLHVLPVGVAGEVRTVCEMPDGIGDVAWSPDGRWLAFISRHRDPRYEAKDASWQAPRKVVRFGSRLNAEDWVFDRPEHVYVVAADGTGRPRDLTPGEFTHAGVSWLPDSSAIVTSAARHDGYDRDLAIDLFVVPLDGEIRALTAQTGTYFDPSVSPDGSSVAFLGVDVPLTYPQNSAVGLVPIGGGPHRWISTALDRTFQSTPGYRAPVWLDDRRLIATAEDRGEVHLYLLDVDASPPTRLTDGPISVHSFDASAGKFVATWATVSQGVDAWVHEDDRASRDDQRWRQMTHVAASGHGWERFAAPCRDGSGEIDAWIMRPDGFDQAQRYPVLLNVHGGPFSQYGETFFDEAQMQARAGFVVVMSNPRGSSGRDTAWAQAIGGPLHAVMRGTGWGTVDVDDVMTVLDTALERYEFCDRDRVGMLGGSYGGFMATTLAARYGDRFRAICSERAVNNLLSEEWSADIGTFFRSEHGPDPVENPSEYLRMSPVLLAADIHVPMLLIHSEEDYRCPINQAEELWMTLRLLGRDVTFYRFPGENHELSRSGSPVHRQQRAEIILDFFTERLAVRADSDAQR